MKKTCVLLAILGLGSLAPLSAAAPQPKLQCESTKWVIDGLSSYCEMREVTAAFAGSIDVDSSPTGSVSIRGWDDASVLIRILVLSAAPDEGQANFLAHQVSVMESAGVIRSTGPSRTMDRQWSVSYEIFVPRGTDLTLNAEVGATSVQDVTGTVRCGANVGAIQLISVNGDVQCHTAVGAISIALAGDHWEGAGLRVRTNVGAIEFTIPPNYSAHLDLSTALGSINSTSLLPVLKNGLARSVATDLGAGGATISASTAVGAIVVK